MEIYKAIRSNIAVFINQEKFEEFWDKGYTIYKVIDLEDISKDKIIERTTIV